jgi:hypothetical protein
MANTIAPRLSALTSSEVHAMLGDDAAKTRRGRKILQVDASRYDVDMNPKTWHLAAAVPAYR